MIISIIIYLFLLFKTDYKRTLHLISLYVKQLIASSGYNASTRLGAKRPLRSFALPRNSCAMNITNGGFRMSGEMPRQVNKTDRHGCYSAPPNPESKIT